MIFMLKMKIIYKIKWYCKKYDDVYEWLNMFCFLKFKLVLYYCIKIKNNDNVINCY